MNGKIQIGSIVHGTLRNEDLLAVFADELEYVTDGNAGDLQLISDAREIDPDDESATDVVLELEDSLNAYAPDFVYFGSHAGDGSDFGWWPDFSSLEMAIHDGELPRVSDPADAPANGLAVFVNDHGNVTVYLNGNVLWDCV